MKENADIECLKWAEYPSSVVVPGVVGEPAIGGKSPRSRIRDVKEIRFYCVCTPVALNFPGFVYLLGKRCTGRNVLKACEMMPMLKEGKQNRCSSTSTRS